MDSMGQRENTLMKTQKSGTAEGQCCRRRSSICRRCCLGTRRSKHLIIVRKADVLADVREIRVLRFRSSMCAPAANHLHQFATGCGCDNEGNVMNGFSGRKVYGAALNKHRAMPSVTV